MRALINVFLLSMCIISFSSCATIFTGFKDKIIFESHPSGATIYVDGVKKGITPDTLAISRPGFNQTWVSFYKEGYQAHHFPLLKEFNPIFILNILVGIPMIIDFFSGAIFRYQPLEYEIQLKPEN